MVKLAVLLRVPFIIYHKITLNIPFKLFFWFMTSLQLRCFSKSGHFASRLRSSRDSGFSVEIGTVPPKSIRLETLHHESKLKTTHHEQQLLQLTYLTMSHSSTIFPSKPMVSLESILRFLMPVLRKKAETKRIKKRLSL